MDALSTPEIEELSPGKRFVELRLRRGEKVNLRAWFYPFLAALAIAVLLGSQQATVPGPVPQLALLLAYMSLACTFCPLPTTPVVLWAAAPPASYGLGLHPLLLAGVCALGTAVANLHDYHLLTFLYRFRPVRRVRRARLYEKAATWFESSPFATLAAASFLPIPIDVVRLLAISQGYPRGRFAAASLVGRWPRYVALAYFADRFSLGWQWLLAILAVTVLVGLWRGVPRIAAALKSLKAKQESLP